VAEDFNFQLYHRNDLYSYQPQRKDLAHAPQRHKVPSLAQLHCLNDGTGPEILGETVGITDLRTIRK
jgi:hypothetical protein